MAFNSIKYEWACNIKLIKRNKKSERKTFSLADENGYNKHIYMKKKKYTEEIPIGHSSALRQKEFWGRKNTKAEFLFLFIYLYHNIVLFL